jgi:hypothetical protein
MNADEKWALLRREVEEEINFLEEKVSKNEMTPETTIAASSIVTLRGVLKEMDIIDDGTMGQTKMRMDTFDIPNDRFFEMIHKELEEIENQENDDET